MEIIHYITNIPAETWYHLAAFVLTGAGAQYTVQLFKVIAKNEVGKGVLRFLNGTVSTLYVAAGAFAAGGVGLGNFTKASATVATISVLIYRFHNSFLYKGAQSMVDEALKTETPVPIVPATGIDAPVTPAGKFI